MEVNPPPWSPLSDPYCTGEDRSSDEGDDDPSLPEPESVCRGGGSTTSLADDASCPQRPVRSTRGKVPQKLDDYDLSTMLAEASPRSLDDPNFLRRSYDFA